MNAAQPMHQYVDAKNVEDAGGLRSEDCILHIRQEPRHARVAVGKEKDRKPVDPPPIVQLFLSPHADPSNNYLQSPYVFMSCSLVGQHQDEHPSGSLGTSLAGTLVSSLHRLKDLDNTDGAFFVFADLSVKIEGNYRLKFTLHEVRGQYCHTIREIVSNPFPVHSTKNFPGMAESTFLTRSFSDQGVRLRLRKEPRALLRKRGPAHDDYEPRHYQRAGNQRNPTQDVERHIENPEMQHNEHGELDLQHSQAHVGYEQRSLHRQYSTTSLTGQIPYNESNKRPRTGSEQSHTSSLGQQVQPLENTAYTTRMYTDPQQPFNSYAQQPQQPVAYGFSYTQSPSSAHSHITSREQYFAQRLNTAEATPPYDLQAQRSPTGYYPSQQQALRYPQSPASQQGQYGGSILAPSPPQRVETTFEGLGIGRGQTSPGIGAPDMSGIPPMYGRLSTATTYAPMSTAIPIRRDSYNNYPLQSTNYTPGIVPGFLDRPGVQTTSASDNGY